MMTDIKAGARKGEVMSVKENKRPRLPSAKVLANAGLSPVEDESVSAKRQKNILLASNRQVNNSLVPNGKNIYLHFYNAS